MGSGDGSPVEAATTSCDRARSDRALRRCPTRSIRSRAHSGGPAQVALLSPTAPPVPVNVDLGLVARTGAHGTVVLGGNIRSRWADRCSTSLARPGRERRRARLPGDDGPRACTIGLPEVGVTHLGSLIDKPGKGHWIYRVAVAANWLDDPTYGDVYLVSSPLRVTIR